MGTGGQPGGGDPGCVGATGMTPGLGRCPGQAGAGEWRLIPKGLCSLGRQPPARAQLPAPEAVAPAWAEPTPFPASWELWGWGSARPPKPLRQEPVCALDTAGLPAALGRLGSQGSSPVLGALSAPDHVPEGTETTFTVSHKEPAPPAGNTGALGPSGDTRLPAYLTRSNGSTCPRNSLGPAGQEEGG